MQNSRISAGGALLARLKAIGVDYIFANSGTDFPPIIEGLAEAKAKQIALPRAVAIPHENAAMGMAFGYYLATGRAQAVMAHTNVGLANCAIGAINAATDHIPLLLFSGRTPALESGRLGARTVPISWGQEMRDQTALIREACKWDYELRFPEQVLDVVDRAHAMAMSTPRGPVYISLPREVLCQSTVEDDLHAPSRMSPAIAAPTSIALERAVELLARAERPLIIAQRGAGSHAAYDALSCFVDAWGIPVVQYWATRLSIGTRHPMFVGADPSPWLEEADVVLVVDCLAPWSPDKHHLAKDCKVIQLGQDPLFSRFPIRNFRADVALPGDVTDTLLSLIQAMRPHEAACKPACKTRRAKITAASTARREQIAEQTRLGSGEPMNKAWVSHCLSRAIKGHAATVLSELGCPLEPLELDGHGSWYQEPHSGGLGWSLPTALGMKLADPDKLVVATMGDGSYVFANPVACHQIAEALELPILILVLNNSGWGAVRQSVLDLYPAGYAAQSNDMPLVSVSPSPDFTKVAEASRAWTARVDMAADLPATLEAAIHQVLHMRRQALIEIRIAP